jgi:hypothetical protein
VRFFVAFDPQGKKFNDLSFRARRILSAVNWKRALVYACNSLSLCMTWGAPFAIILAGSRRNGGEDR